MVIEVELEFGLQQQEIFLKINMLSASGTSIWCCGHYGRFRLDRDRKYHISCAIWERGMLIDTGLFNNTATTAGVM
jgi:hypothetical protein